MKAKPIRLSQELMIAAAAAAIIANRTPSEQIEHWALLGQQANKTIKLDDMINVLCGIAQLKVKKT